MGRAYAEAQLAGGDGHCRWADRCCPRPHPCALGLVGDGVDGGEVVRLLLERARRQPPSPPSLTILEVFRTLEEIAGTAGKGSQGRKEALLKGLLERATPLEAKYLAKLTTPHG